MQAILPILLCLLWGCDVIAAEPSDTIRFKPLDTERERVVIERKQPARTDTLLFHARPTRRRLLDIPMAEIELTDTTLYAMSAPRLSGDTLVRALPATRDLFRRDWFAYLRMAYHTFQGDYSSIASFGGTLSPEVSAGVGYWFNPWIGVSVEFTRSESRGYTTHVTDFGFGYGDVMLSPSGMPYRKMKTEWWSAIAAVHLNLTRIFSTYEGLATRRHLNVVCLNGGLGTLRHLAYNQIYGNGYQMTGYVELVYSRFFNKNRRFSLDVGVRWLMANTNFDFDSKSIDKTIHRIDSNIAVGIGFSVYLGRFGRGRNPSDIIRNYKVDFR